MGNARGWILVELRNVRNIINDPCDLFRNPGGYRRRPGLSKTRREVDYIRRRLQSN